MPPGLQTIIRLAAERTLNSVIAGIVLTILAWALLRLLPQRNAGTRVAVWLALLVALPGICVAAIFLTDAAKGSVLPFSPVAVPEQWAFAAFLVWAATAGMLLLRVGFGVWRICHLRQSCTPLEIAHLDPGVMQVIEQTRLRRRVSFLQSETVRVPMAIGFFVPAIIVPSWTLRELSPPELSAVFLHELAHLRRCDDWTNFFQKILRALFFFHPVMWWLDRRVSLDREMACDDMVLSATNNAHGYARCLVNLAERSLLRRSLALAQAAVHRAQQISLRVGRIMDAGRPRSTRVSKIALAGVGTLAGACLVAVLHSPTFIAFEGSAPETYASRSLSSEMPLATSDPAVAGVIPASLRKTVASTRPGSRKRSHVIHRANFQTRAAVVRTKAEQPAGQQPQLLRARFSSNIAIMPVESMFLMVRDGSADSSGRVIWRVTVWRLTVFPPVQSQAEEAGAANSI